MANAVKDVTKEKQAKTAQDVNNQDSRTRLWQSLNTTYSNQMEESDKAYDSAISQQNNAMLKRGMGRSSYSSQISANMYDDKVNARNKLGQALIADYQNRIGEIEQQEKEDERWERQFAENQRQYNETLAYNREEAEKNRAFQTSEREASQKYSTAEREAGQKYSTAERLSAQQYQSDENALSREAQKNLQILQQEWQSKENLASREAQKALQELEQEFQKGENAKNRELQETLQQLEQEWQSGEKEKDREASATLQRLQQEWQSSESALDRQQNQTQFEIEQAFKEKQLQAQQDQWKQEFDYQKMSADQQRDFNIIMTAAANGGDVSDALLNKFLILRSDYEAMKAQAAQITSSGNPGNRDTRSAWEKAGFSSEEDYKAAAALGLTADEYAIYKSRQSTGKDKIKIDNSAIKDTGTQTGFLTRLKEILDKQ